MKKDLGVEKEQILHTAQSLTYDHVPAKSLSITSAWVDRYNDVETLEKVKDSVDYTWRFKSLGDMADAVEEAFREPRAG